MQVYTRNTLIDRMIVAMRAESNDITYFGPGPTRSLLSAVAGELQHLYYSVYQTEQANSALSASGDALDAQAAERGLTRLGASAASALVTIEVSATVTGTGTISTSGTTVNGTGTLFLTQVAVGDTLIAGSVRGVVTSAPVDNDGPITVGSSMGTLTNSAFQIQKTSITVPVSPTPLQVTTNGGTVFQATENVTLVATYSGSNTLRGVVPMVSSITGPAANVAAFTLTRVVNPNVVPLVSAVTSTNRSAAQGGTVEESDSQLRSRIVNVVSSLNQGTAAFYEAQVRVINPRIIRVYLARGSALNEVLVYCLTSDGATLTPAEKSTLTSDLSEVVPVQTKVTIRDMVLQPIDITFATTLRTGFTLQNVRDSMVESCRQFLDWSTWPFGRVVQQDDLLRVASGAAGVDRLDVSTFSPVADIEMPPATLPRVGEITIQNIATGETMVIDSVTSQYPRLD